MNARCFRLIFSKSLGFLIPVAEIARAKRKAGQQQTSTPAKPVLLSLLLAGLPTFALAEIVLDPTQRAGTNVISAANGVPVIEIANPNGKGLSHNRFTEFDVRQPGIIYNNSLVNGVSELGGAMLRNPNLSRAARAILTEVTGNKPSSISGTLEVFGTKADLLFANPNGLTLNGVTTLNTSSLTVSTGRVRD
ncbi:two-partner secretion domain-containing protein, partial [Pseudomonas turukhanskensis]|uniref:two-partner secretion domain-containing protein n=1 Tax=Pseudomonas turukhanskensis TaxID=1806536 RepID=UPI0022F34709